MEVKAQVKYIRVSPRKIGLVARAIRGLSPQEALDKLAFVGKSAAPPLAKLIKSAIANAENNAKLKKESFKIKSLQVYGGPSLKRWRPASRGRAMPYKKRSSHIKIVLEGNA